MKLTLMTRPLLRVLSAAQKIIAKKNMLPVLDNFKFGKDDKGYYVMASSSEHGLRLELDVTECEGDFKDFLVTSSELVSILFTIDAELIYMTVDGGSMKVDYQTGTFSLPAMEATDYPALVFGEPELTFNCAFADVCKAMSTAVAYADQTTLIRPQMCSVLLDVVNDGLVVVATDGHKLYKRTFDFGAPFIAKGEPTKLLVPVSVVKIVESVFGGEESVEICSTATKMRFRTPVAELVVTKVEGRYPNYNSVIPSKFTFDINFSLADLKRSVKRASLFVSRTEARLLRIEFSRTDGTHIKAEDIDYSQECDDRLPDESVKVSDDAPDTFRIGVNGGSLASSLADIKTENVVLHFVDESRAMVLREDDPKSSLVLLLMPMLLND